MVKPSRYSDARTLLGRSRTARAHLVRNTPSLHDPILCRALIVRSNALRYSDPTEMVHVALLAADIGKRCVALASPDYADLQSEALVALANALKVRGLFRSAQRAFEAAAHFEAQGTGREDLRCSRLEKLGSLCMRRAHFSEAKEHILAALGLRRQLGQALPLAAALLLLSLCEVESGASLAALRAANEGLDLVPISQDPKLALALRHQGINCLVELGHLPQALSALARTEPLYGFVAEPTMLVRYHWLRGRVLSTLPESPRDFEAESEYRTAVDAAASAHLPYEVAKLTLELAAFYASRGRLPDLRSLLRNALPMLDSLGVARDSSAARILMRCACAEEDAVTLLRDATARVDRLVSNRATAV